MGIKYQIFGCIAVNISKQAADNFERLFLDRDRRARSNRSNLSIVVINDAVDPVRD